MINTGEHPNEMTEEQSAEKTKETSNDVKARIGLRGKCGTRK